MIERAADRRSGEQRVGNQPADPPRPSSRPRAWGFVPARPVGLSRRAEERRRRGPARPRQRSAACRPAAARASSEAAQCGRRPARTHPGKGPVHDAAVRVVSPMKIRSRDTRCCPGQHGALDTNAAIFSRGRFSSSPPGRGVSRVSGTTRRRRSGDRQRQPELRVRPDGA